MKKRIRKNAMMQPKSMFETVIDLFSQMDTDRDGVPDRRDCRPLDPRKQHIRPSRAMRQRLQDLPIFVSSEKELKKRLERGEISPEAYSSILGLE